MENHPQQEISLSNPPHLQTSGAVLTNLPAMAKAIASLDSYIKHAFAKEDRVVSIFLDRDKAYETTWRYGILMDLHSFGFRGRLTYFFDQFSQRSPKVRIGSTFSTAYSQEMGVPQGSSLSVTLFSIKMNSIVSALRTEVLGSLYVNDFLASFRHKDMTTIESGLQPCLRRLQHWADTTVSVSLLQNSLYTG